jgi:hypothetical protein
MGFEDYNKALGIVKELDDGDKAKLAEKGEEDVNILDADFEFDMEWALKRIERRLQYICEELKCVEMMRRRDMGEDQEGGI